MAQVACPECGHRASGWAVACPRCRCPLAGPPPAPAPRSWWVVLVYVLYVVLAAAVTFGPVVLAGLVAVGYPNQAAGYLVAASAYFLVVFGGGASLLVIPVRATWATPDRKRRIWLPLIGSGLLAALVFAGFALAASELVLGTKGADSVALAVLAAIPFVWLVWGVVFWLVSRSTDPLTWNGRLYKSLLAGSVLELLVAVPMHLIVRRRDECCAGMYTATGIGVGLIVAVIALGPAVFFLFFRRHKQAYGNR